MQTSSKQLRYFWLANFAFLSAFALIPDGLSNPLSIVWLMLYYIYWCGFFRVYFKKKPYFLTMDIFGSIIPSTKIFFITVLAAFLLIILLYLPLFMWFNEKYLLFFEKYMEALQNAGGYARLEVYEECWHVFQQMPIHRAEVAMESAGRFVQRLL